MPTDGEPSIRAIWQLQCTLSTIAKAARHPVVEERPVGRHRERPDIRALGRSGGTELFDVTICHPLSHARIRDAVENPLNLLKAAWTAKFLDTPACSKRPDHGSTCYLFRCQQSVVGTRTHIRRYALSQVPLRQEVCPHFPALGASCSSATRLYL